MSSIGRKKEARRRPMPTANCAARPICHALGRPEWQRQRLAGRQRERDAVQHGAGLARQPFNAA